jgi:Tfp pilus assembly protein PilP
MKRTLTLCLLVGLAVPSWAQTSQPKNVKVVAVPAAQPKPSAAKPAAKPVVIAAKPAAKPAVTVVPAKPAAQSPKPQVQAKPTVAVVPAKPAAPSSKPVIAVVPAKSAMPGTSAHQRVAAKADQHPAKVAVAPKSAIASGNKDPFHKDKKQAVVVAAPSPKAPEKTGTVVAVKDNSAAAEKKPEPRKISAVGRRDPFVSPVVRMGAVGSGCSSGKRCLAIDQVALKGVVKSETGMIAVVVNAMDKAYFLRENDPVFNGYVTKITSDSIVFKETFHDKLGKELTRDVTKTISRPAA